MDKLAPTALTKREIWRETSILLQEETEPKDKNVKSLKHHQSSQEIWRFDTMNIIVNAERRRNATSVISVTKRRCWCDEQCRRLCPLKLLEDQVTRWRTCWTNYRNSGSHKTWAGLFTLWVSVVETSDELRTKEEKPHWWLEKKCELLPYL